MWQAVLWPPQMVPEYLKAVPVESWGSARAHNQPLLAPGTWPLSADALPWKTIGNESSHACVSNLITIGNSSFFLR